MSSLAQTAGRVVGYADLARSVRKMRHATRTCVRDNARRHLARRMGRLRGLPQKIGQMLAMSENAPRDDPLAALPDSAEPLPFSVIERELRRAWGPDSRSRFRSIDPVGLAASLGQVHRAVLDDGREVAIKVRYPGIRKAVMTDLKALGWLSVPMGDLRRGFDLADYRQEVLRDLEEELDYRVEARHQKAFRARLGAVPGWVVPEVLDEWTRDRVLVTAWASGQRVDDAASWPQPVRDRLGKVLVAGFLHTLFRHGWVHADPNPGNYRFIADADTPGVVLYDFGSVAALDRARQMALLKLIEITVRESGDPYKPLVALGFRAELLSPIRDRLPAVCRTLFEPFTIPGKVDLSRWNLGQRMDDILGADRWNLRMAGPAHMLFIMRAFHGLVYYLGRLDAHVCWSRLIAPLFSEHRAALDQVDTSAGIEQTGTFETMARHLRIAVRRGGDVAVSLTMPARSVDDVSDLIDDEIADRIRRRGIDLESVVARVRRAGYAPAELFTLDDEGSGKTVRVWLE